MPSGVLRDLPTPAPEKLIFCTTGQLFPIFIPPKKGLHTDGLQTQKLKLFGHLERIYDCGVGDTYISELLFGFPSFPLFRLCLEGLLFVLVHPQSTEKAAVEGRTLCGVRERGLPIPKHPSDAPPSYRDVTVPLESELGTPSLCYNPSR